MASVLPDVACTSSSHAHGWNRMARAQHSGVGWAATSIGFSQDWVAMASLWDVTWPTKGAHGEPGSCGRRVDEGVGGWVSVCFFVVKRRFGELEEGSALLLARACFHFLRLRRRGGHAGSHAQPSTLERE
jgi:hypothetical protein